VLGLALPATALAAALDLAAGRPMPGVLATAGFGLAFLAVLCLAAERGRGSAAVACAWWLCVPCLAILPAVARWGTGDPALAVGASPLGWVFLRAAGPSAPPFGAGAGVPWPAAAVAVSLWGLARWLTGSPRP
jgi:hypothetical protein